MVGAHVDTVIFVEIPVELPHSGDLFRLIDEPELLPATMHYYCCLYSTMMMRWMMLFLAVSVGWHRIVFLAQR